jgi:hypothetical protein
MKIKMIKATIAGLMLSVTSVASAGLILKVDLSIENTITIISTSETSLITMSGNYNDGFYLADFFLTGLDEFQIESTGTLTSANEGSADTPELWSESGDTGLNIFSYLDFQLTSNSTSSFTIGSRAFSGQTSWAVSSDIYRDVLNGVRGGNVYFPADEVGEISPELVLGAWQVTALPVPEPPTLVIFALGMIGSASRRFKKQS